MGNSLTRYLRVVRCANVMGALHEKDPERYPRDARSAFYMSPSDVEKASQEAEERGVLKPGVEKQLAFNIKLWETPFDRLLPSGKRSGEPMATLPPGTYCVDFASRLPLARDAERGIRREFVTSANKLWYEVKPGSP